MRTIGVINIAFVNFLSYEMNTYFNKTEDITEQSDINKCFAVGKQLNYFWITSKLLQNNGHNGHDTAL